MKDEVKESMIREFNRIAGVELGDEELDKISGGRILTSVQRRHISSIMKSKSNELNNGVISEEEYNTFMDAVYRYVAFVNGQESGEPILLFNYDDWKQ